MPDKDHRAILGFTAPWFSLGVITEAELTAAGAEYEASGDTHAEHYRCGAFRRHVDANRPLPETTATALYELGAADADPAMGQAIMADILGLPECPASLLTRAENSGIKHLVRTAERRRLLTEIQSSALTEERFERCLASRDSVVQRYLIENAALSRQQAEALAGQGAGKAIRKLAVVWLRRKVYEKREVKKGCPEG